MGFRFTIQTVLIRAIGLLPFNRFQPQSLKAPTYIRDRIVRYIQCLADFGFAQPFIYFEQDPGSCQLAGGCHAG